MWRSRRRTLITISSIFFAVIFAIFMRVIVVGIFDKMITDTVSMSCGYIQIHQKGYWASKAIDSSFEESSKLAEILSHEKEITIWAPRLETFTLASSGEHTKGIMIIGTDPEKENSISHLSQKLIKGNYFTGNEKDIILSEELAEYLKLNVNDTVILLGQGYQGNMAAGKYPVKGIVRLAIPEMNKSMAWLPIKFSREFLSTDARYTSLSLLMNDRNHLDAVKKSIEKQTAGSGYEVMTWKEMLPELDQMFEAKMGQNVIMSGVLYLVIAFGIFGTILMMLNERMHEFGILIAIGMKKGILSQIVVMEMVLMTIVGTVMGIIVSYPLVLYFYFHPVKMGGTWGAAAVKFNFDPVIRPSIDISNFLLQGYIVMGIAILLSLYSIYKIHKIRSVEAINS